MTGRTVSNLRTVAAIVFIVLLGLAASHLRAADAPVVIKLATLAPKGTSLHQTLQLMGEKWRTASNGAVTLTIYPDGVQGGEAQVVSRMRLGQLQAAMLTVQGLSEIDSSVTALEDIPMAFRSLDEVTAVREKLHANIEKRFRDRGFVLLFWGDAGWVRFFTKDAVIHPADLKKTKLFASAGSPEQEDIMKSAGFQPVPLDPVNAYTALKTGMINAIPTIPLAALAGQFYGPSPHMLNVNWAPLVGGTVVTAKVWDALPAATQAALLKAAAEAGNQITLKSRAESAESVEAMKKRGLTVHEVSPELDAEWRKFAEDFYPKIRGRMVPADLFDEVQRVLKEFRK